MIRPAMSTDCPQIFRLLCNNKGAQTSYPAFERTLAGRLQNGQELCLVSDDGGRVNGFVALRREHQKYEGEKARLSDLVVAQGDYGMRANLMVRACEFANAVGFAHAEMMTVDPPYHTNN